MRAWIVIALAGCAREVSGDIDVDCPPEASVESVQYGDGDQLENRKTCKWADRKVVVTTDRHGTVIERQGFRDGAFDGRWLSSRGGVRSETQYRRGVLDGWSREYRGAELIAECRYVDGTRDGVCWNQWGGMQFDRGRREGIWRIGAQVRIYGGGVLLGADGRALPPPRASIEVDGVEVVRERCDLRAYGVACLELFEDFQRCEVDTPDRDACHAAAREKYRYENARLERRKALDEVPGAPVR